FEKAAIIPGRAGLFSDVEHLARARIDGPVGSKDSARDRAVAHGQDGRLPRREMRSQHTLAAAHEPDTAPHRKLVGPLPHCVAVAIVDVDTALYREALAQVAGASHHTPTLR